MWSSSLTACAQYLVAAQVGAATLSSLVSDGQYDLGTRVAVQLGQAKTAAELSLAANSAWAACTALQRSRVRIQPSLS